MPSIHSAQPTTAPLGELFPIVEPNSSQLLRFGLAVVIGAAILIHFIASTRGPKYPLLNPASILDLGNWDLKKQFAWNAKDLLHLGLSQYKDKVFKLNTDAGEITILPPVFINDIRNEKNFNFMKFVAEDFHAYLPGFEAFSGGSTSDRLIQDVVRKQLTKSLNRVTEPLSEETSFATELHFGTSQDWSEYTLHPEILDIVARISSRVFLGTEICRDSAWLQITKSYTILAFNAAASLRRFPKWTRNFVHWFHPQCRVLRQMLRQAKDIIRPVIEKRRKFKAENLKGQGQVDINDAMEWFEEESKGIRYNPATTQLTLSMAAIHTTTDLLSETLLRLARRPELVEEIRQEITTVLEAEGWKKTSLYNMKLLDSVIKETQRLRPISLVTMNRKAVADVILPNGDIIRKGTRVVCPMTEHLNPSFHENPEAFDAHRFERQRGTATENTAHLVSTSPGSMGFGHGLHACPGRFFAANEIKVALCHLIVKYDWKVGPEAPSEPKPISYCFRLQVDSRAKVFVRRRSQVELDIDKI